MEKIGCQPNDDSRFKNKLPKGRKRLPQPQEREVSADEKFCKSVSHTQNPLCFLVWLGYRICLDYFMY
ncbi:hypothetical protein [Pseudomonas viridiflava]|uniref:hypothetical protein n=1 Tax=Pseudomonas viridiflava TaxID=33069 RepID=UPI001982034C|nr:hypothetical protein [Pseudomonas viridiflava]